MTNQGHIERPKCENQVKLMSEFPFETDKPEWRKDLTDGKAITADPTEDLDEVRIVLAESPPCVPCNAMCFFFQC